MPSPACHRPPSARPLGRRRAPASGVRSALMLVLTAGLAGCSTNTSTDPPGVTRENLPPDTLVDARPAAFVNGLAVPWGRLRDELTEAAGAEILGDLVLERQIERALADASIQLRPADIREEQDRLLAQLAIGAADADDAARRLAALRDRRGLGPARFRSLLRRNAGLRALATPQVQISEADRAVMHDVLHGPRRQVRLLTVPGLDETGAVRDALAAGRSFADVATEQSTDFSAARGGLLEPFAAADPAYPRAIRDAAFALASPGEVSPAIRLPDGIALVQLVAITPGDGTDRASSAEAVERLARLAAERTAMDRLARDLLNGAAITIIDPSLQDAWDRAKRRRRQPG